MLPDEWWENSPRGRDDLIDRDRIVKKGRPTPAVSDIQTHAFQATPMSDVQLRDFRLHHKVAFSSQPADKVSREIRISDGHGHSGGEDTSIGIARPSQVPRPRKSLYRRGGDGNLHTIHLATEYDDAVWRQANVSSETEQHLKHEFRKLGRDASPTLLAAAVEAEIDRLERQATSLRRLRETLLRET